MTIDRTVLIAVVTICALAAPLFGTAAPERATGPVTLRFMTTEDYRGADPVMVSRAKLYETFKQKYPNIDVRMELVPWEQIYSQVIVADEAGAAPDIFWMGARASYEVLKGERAMPLNDFLSKEEIEDLKGPILDMVTEGGKYYLVPTTTDVRVLYYRKDLFRQAGLNPDTPPRTWDQTIQYAQKLTEAPNRWGYGIVGGMTLHTPHLWMVNMFMGGGDLIDSKKKAIYNSPAGFAAGQYFADMVYKHKVSPRESVSVMYPDIERGLTGGSYAMTGIGSWSYDPFVKALGADAVGWSRLPIPAGGKDASFSGGWGFMISSATKRPREAWAFVSHMASREAMLDVALSLTTLPHRQSVIDDPRIRNTYIGAMAAYAREASRFNPKNENNGPLFDGINVALQEILQGRKTPQQALNDAANSYNAKYYKP